MKDGITVATEENKHMELYKKYRPEKWDELLGQQKVAKSLQNAVIKNKLPTAYIFLGPKGCGKTSAALLLAKSINCLNVDELGNPCNECDICQSIENNTQIGVNYESMANNGSVDDVRELVKRAYLNQPVNKTVFILDEIHNLSKAAFDSLLIPLEAKDFPALLIFCSTESDKIPGTITSRAQQRRFSTVGTEELTNLLENISQKEKITVNEESINEAIRKGHGSVRSTLSVFEEIITTGETLETFDGIILQKLSEHDLPGALSTVSEAINNGYDGADLAEELFSDLRDLLLVAASLDKNLAKLIPVNNVSQVIKGFYGKTGIISVAEEIGDAINHMTIGSDSRIHLEIALVKSINCLKKIQKIAAKKSS